MASSSMSTGRGLAFLNFSPRNEDVVALVEPRCGSRIELTAMCLVSIDSLQLDVVSLFDGLDAYSASAPSGLIELAGRNEIDDLRF